MNPNPDVTTALLEAGGRREGPRIRRVHDGMLKDKDGRTAFEHAQENRRMKTADAYWRLNEAQY